MNRVDPQLANRQIEAILSSDAMRNRESLRRLLRFLADHSIAGSADSLKEYTVGVAVFGKPEMYDPQVDPSARVHLGKLRQKLDEYYRTEGHSDPLLVEIPPRRFALQFTTPAAPVTAEVVPEPRSPMPRLLAGAAVLAAVAGLVGYVIGRANPGLGLPSHEKKVISRFWGPVASNHRPTVVCLATPLFLRMGDTRVRAPAFGSFEEAKNLELAQSIRRALEVEQVTAVYDATGIGEATGAFLLGNLFSRIGIQAELRRESAVSWEDIKDSNVIFLGSAKFNPKLQQMSSGLNFVAERGGIRNRGPLPGELAVYGKTEGPDKRFFEDCTLISRLPGVHPETVFVMLGSSSFTGAWAATECVVNPARLEALLARVAGGKELPAFFEAVVKVQYRENVPVEMSTVAYRAVSRK